MSAPQSKVSEELPGVTPRQTRTSVSSRVAKTTLFAFAALVITLFARITHKQLWHCIQSASFDTANDDACPQAPEFIPVKNNALWATLTEIYGTEAFRSQAVDWLSGAIQIPTESYDQMDPIGVDPRWEKFAVFHDYLAKAFPLVHSTLELTKVNTYGLIFVWKGSDPTLKPLLLAGHQDVVPVEPATYDAWTYPPFSGHYDGNSIWGRGSVDDKSGLIGILSAMETMLVNGYQPARTVVLASGFDEESGGNFGAKTLALELLEMFGENGYAMLVDEGAGYGEQYGQVIATPGIAEKGAVDTMIEITTPGGHSSLPPPHTSIGLLAGFLVAIEKNPFDVHLARGSPMYKSFQCVARYAPDLPDSLRRNIINAEHSEKALRSAEKELFRNGKIKNLVGTTQAIDLVRGGVKINALPERAYAVINHRIAVERREIHSVAATLDRDARLVESLAREYNLSYIAFGVDVDGDMNAPGDGTVTLSTAFESELEPAPITPAEEDAAPYRLLSGSIKAAYNSHRGISGDDHIIVSPGMMSGNTDTKFYWKLTPHIFRYGHTDGAVGGTLLPGVHTVNEAISASSFVEIIRFFTALILNVDESLLV
ncbi:carboxypeptidase S [Imleria badia]|nr:carboxypeptidase S [Imleria badia]